MAIRYGAIAERIENALPESVAAKGVAVYVGVAPINTIENGADVVNKPVLVRSFAEAVKMLGYSDNWADFPLCEAIREHFLVKNVGPVVFIHAATLAQMGSTAGEGESQTPANGMIVLDGMGKIVLDSVTVGTKVKGTDYTIRYDYESEKIIIKETSEGSLGTASLSIGYNVVTPATSVTASVIIGTDDGEGTRTGLQAIHDVYELTGLYPCDIACPGFSSTKSVHDAMEAVSSKISGHYYANIWTDIPLVNDETAMTLASAAEWKADNGYTCDNEKVCFPMYADADGRKHHISVTALACKQALDAEYGLPYQSAANQEADIVKLYFGEGVNKTPGEAVLNETLIKNGITTAAFVSGRWVIWGARMASFVEGENENALNRNDTGMQMLYHIMNDFQERRGVEISKTVSKNRMEQIAAEENAKLDLMVGSGAILSGKCRLYYAETDIDEIKAGHFDLVFDISTDILTNSLRALVRYSEDGLNALIEEVYGE